MNLAIKLFSFAIIGLVVTVAWAAPPEVVDRGWKAQVELAGNGDRALALVRMKELADFQNTVFNGLEFHPQTQTFIDDMWGNLESFNLGDFYKQLPEADGEWRQLRVYGARKGNQYQVGPDAAAIGLNPTGETANLGDMSVRVQAKKIKGSLGDHYLLQNEMQLGVGEIQWPAMQMATVEALKVMVNGAPEFQSEGQQFVAQQYRDKALSMNPDLGVEDVDIIAPLWASFPAMWELLSKVGRIEDVVYHNLDKPYRQLKASFVIDPEKMKKSYPHIGKHLLSMDRLFNGTFRLTDERGELLTAELDSKKLRGNFQAFVADGKIVPVKGGEVMLDANPIADDKPWNLTAHMNSTMSILGVVTHIDNARAKVQFLSKKDGFKLVGQLSDVPDIRVQGKALGFMPTAMIDVVMPKSLAEIIQEFIGVVCHGNEGKGFLLGVQFQQSPPGQSSQLILKSAFEGLDNFFMRIGMGIVNDRVLPDPKVSEEVRQFVFDAQAAFAEDLKAFESIVTKIAPEKQVALRAVE
ncbi:hypothetical protein FT643_00635 [Ketobacter sp. MCCC 1A13808]|uniref:hypothetical protein n=1 Tax=Ketobacter sp. MCCC 1A13808 TaxID=2602738 RepID=UPI0012EBBF73|nr:hypothetical protein [Ketobacter sp. MCCC 1A13808]MVF10635.1 hypothetical protein [Ketobacter sp. MCCC 1A13808]